MIQSEAWLAQAASDLAAALAVRKDDDPTTYCQSISKYQQVVEKRAKAVIASVREAGIPFNAITRDHDPSRQIEVLLASRRALNQKLLERLKRMFPDRRIGQIRQLCSLAPRYPSVGQPFPRNTEYPFEDHQGHWTAPSAPDSFNIADVKNAHQIAWLIKNQADRFAEVIKLRP